MNSSGLPPDRGNHHISAMSEPEYLGNIVLILAWLFASIATLVVATRYYVRLQIVKRYTLDDALILLALALAIGNSVFLTIATHWGLGTHMAALSHERIMYSVKWVYLCEFFSILSPGIGRIAYASLLMSLVPPVRWRTRLLWSIIWIQFAVDIATIAVSFSQCSPMRKFWDSRVPGSCWPATVQRDMGYFQGSVCSAVDLVLAAFPASMFWGLNMEKKRKISLSCLMGLGVFAMIASIVKTVQLRAITSQADLTYAMAHLAIWWTLEAYFVLIATSIPTLRPIVTRTTRHSRSVSSKKPSRLNSLRCRLSSHGYNLRSDSLDGPGQLLGHFAASGGGQESPCIVGGEAHPLKEGGHGAVRQGRWREGGIEKTTTIGVVYGRASDV
ncbi:uncharacterized protein BO97DRAFT_453454 [Aspergillus homomorphus CBS 101889]|uniref:Rhodopsin domain-containing protein n=1 Tax=Aspergillus homomorphus (strain CBS 101889) TaxID=1450537 RepID=A0A395HV75_ASPHC|nr:hypothetical protein BO97DRAFT_453454 [Aspergillus homomorphus CBS 101889]RAL11831.1 hypothetical protein BO97DRAFT_453454 [Aspergillus homomorphus CBS 101889]